MAFGRGHDFRISSDCNINNESYSNFGYTYQLPDTVSLNSDEAKSYLAGSYQFKVLEIEVYKVVFTPTITTAAAQVVSGVPSGGGGSSPPPQ